MADIGYKNGITKRNSADYTTTKLPDVVGIHQSLLTTPMFTLSEIASAKTSQISSIIANGEFTMSAAKTKIPTAKHAEYFYVFLGYFADNWNQEGKVYFRFTDILRIMGKHTKSSSSIKVIKESIKRYAGTHVHWENSFAVDASKDNTWGGSLIISSSIFKKPEDSGIVCSPRNDRNKKNWNWIQLHPFLVEALNPKKNPKTRLFLSELFKANTNSAEMIIYRYFYGITDLHYPWYSLYREPDGLIYTFQWTNRKDHFFMWLKKALDGLSKKDLLEKYEFNEDQTAVRVKCHGIDELKKDKQEIVLEMEKSSEPRRNKRKPITIKKDADLLPDEEVLVEYISRKSKGLISESTVDTIDSLLGSLSDAKIIIPAIKRVLLENQSL